MKVPTISQSSFLGSEVTWFWLLHVIIYVLFYLFLIDFILFFKDFIYLFLERGREWEREGEKTLVCGCLSHTRTGDLAHNPGTCPDWEFSQWPFDSQASTQSTEPHHPGLCAILDARFHGLSGKRKVGMEGTSVGQYLIFGSSLYDNLIWSLSQWEPGAEREWVAHLKSWGARKRKARIPLISFRLIPGLHLSWC